MRRVVIVGGGISGLSTAYYLSKTGCRPTLIERQPHLGGVIRTQQIQGCLVEAGPEAFLAAKPAAMELIQELGLEDEVIGSNDHARVTYVVRSGELVPLPEGLMMMAPTRLWPMAATRLLSWPAKVRMGLEWFRRPPANDIPDRSVAEFIKDHYGREALEYLTEPLLAGVYGGDPAQMSVRSVLPRFSEIEKQHGSITRGILAGKKDDSKPIFQTMKRGLGQLVDAIASRCPAELVSGSVETVERMDAGYRVRIGGEWMNTDDVVIACPAHIAAPMVRSTQPALADLLAAIPYTSSMTVALGYERKTVSHPLNGFGFLVPRRERTGIVACTWVNTKFSYRVPEDKALLRCFFTHTDLSDEDAVAVTRADLKRLMGLEAQPSFTSVARWPESMAQYTVGHQQRVSEIERILAGLPGLHLAGNAYYGIGIPDCIRLGRQVAAKIAAARLSYQ